MYVIVKCRYGVIVEVCQGVYQSNDAATADATNLNRPNVSGLTNTPDVYLVKHVGNLV